MKIISISFLVISILSLFSCDSEDARTPLGITISAPDFDLVIEENPDPSTILGTLTASSSDNSTITFGNILDENSDPEDSKFESETPIGALDIDNITGELTIKDVTAFDYDVNTEINATVNAISGIVTEAVNITIFINPDRRTLIEIFNDNPDNTLDWDITETDISDWQGVTLTNNRVTALDLSRSGITTVTASISKLSALTILNLSNNELTTVPDSIGTFNVLEDLNLSNTGLTSLPESFSELESLNAFNISGNNIESVSDEICETFISFQPLEFIADTMVELACREEE